MLHLRELGLLDSTCLTVTGEPLGDVLDWWEDSERRRAPARAAARRRTASIPTTSSWPRPRRARRGLTSTVTFPRGNLAPEGSVIKSTAIDPERRRRRRRLSQDRAGARLHHASATPSPPSRATRPDRLKPGDVLVLICRGPLGAGMEEIYQITVGAQAPLASASTSRCSPTRASPASPPAPASATSAPRRWPAARSARCATATASRSSSTAIGWKAPSTWSATASGEFSPEQGAPRPGRRGRRGPTSPPIRTSAGRHAAVGGAAAASAAARGAAACTTWTRSPAPSSGASRSAASRAVRRARGAGRRRPSSRRLARCRRGDRGPTPACRRPGDHSPAGGRRRRTARRRFGTSA